MSSRRESLKWIAGSLALPVAGLPGLVGAQAAAYPTRTIRIIASSAPGSPTDLAGRLVSEVLANRYHQSVVVDNRAGGGGLIGMQAAASAAPDGYTLATGGLGNNVIPPVTIKGLPIDIPKVLLPVAQVGEFSNVLVVRADHPAKSVQDLVALFKAMKTAPTYGSNGTGTSSHLTSELFALRVGVSVTHVPYKGSTDALIGVANGGLDFCFMNVPPSLPLIAGGKIKALAATSSYRLRQLPEVPTMQEQGVEGFDVTSWLGIYAPAGVPPEIMAKLSADIVEGLATPDYQQRLRTAGFEPKLRRVEEFVAWNNAELKRWGDVAKAANIAFQYGG